MPSYEHKKLIEAIKSIDEIPDDNAAYSEWIKGGNHLRFLEANARSNEVILYASGVFTFVHSAIVSNDNLRPLDKTDLLAWCGDPFSSCAAYITGGGREDIWLERGTDGQGSNALKNSLQPLFIRDFEGWSGEGGTSYEINQELTHLCQIHWRPEQRAYCRYDDKGDLAPIISVTPREGQTDKIALVTVQWENLQEYLAITNASLVRRFDFTLLRHGNFGGWPSGSEVLFDSDDQLFYRQKVAHNAAYTNGVQIVSIRENRLDMMKNIQDGWFGRQARQHIEFLAQDWRHDQVIKISTESSATTNYFDANENDLPFELSPAFFRPEVLSKYKTDKEKYHFGERSITCRTAWHLRGFDVNDAGQIHAYICDLRKLPYEEQLHWLAHNETPKAPISERAYTNDFQGEWVMFSSSLRKITSLLGKWLKKNESVWKTADQTALQKIVPPHTTSTDEWADAFMDLSKLIVEGFDKRKIVQLLNKNSIAYDELSDQTITLLEKLCGVHSSVGGVGFSGLKAIQRIRSKVKGHSGGSEAKSIIRDAISQHETYPKHFEHVCSLAYADLMLIDKFIVCAHSPN